MKDHDLSGEDLGLHLSPGDPHYRAYIGPPADYDLVAAMTFGLMTVLGLRQQHRLLDIGCGSLRIGRLLIPYLNRGGYTGIEPNRWLVEEGMRREIGQSLLAIKQPHFVYGDTPTALDEVDRFDFVVAQSIFSHCGVDLIEHWLDGVAKRLHPHGLLAATFLPGPGDCDGRGWIYPACVSYRPATMRRLAEAAGLTFRVLDWHHPRQAWAAFAKPGCDLGWIDRFGLSWNGSVAAGKWPASP